jgi:AcrR family transcriptional regulator
MLDDYASQKTVDWDNRKVTQILNAAGKCFAQRGYAETSIKEIAGKIGITKSMVHYYFSSKAHLLYEVLTYMNHRHLSRVTKDLKVSEESPLRRARKALNALWSTIRKDKRFLRLSVDFWSIAAHDAKLHDRLRSSNAATRKTIAEGIAEALGGEKEKLPVEDEVLAALILAVVHGLSVQDYIEPEGVNVDDVFRLFVAALTAGMANLDIED